MSATENIRNRFSVLMSDGAFVWGKIDELQEWDSVSEFAANMGLIAEFTSRAVVGLEYIATESSQAFGEFITSAQKQGIVADFILSKLPIPGWLGRFVRPLVIGCIDAAVAVLNNKSGGKDWNVATKAKAIALVRAEQAGK